MLDVNDLSVVYPDGTCAISKVSFHLKDGENVALIGANGAGKSSLLLALVGILPSEGEIVASGVHLTKRSLAEIRRKVGLVFQNPDDQLFMASIYDDVAFGPRNLGLSEEETAQRVDETLKLLHIEHLRSKTSLKISGGEKRIAAIATVLAMRPDIILFDEPTAFLDPRARRNLINLLKVLPHTKLIATHDLAFTEALCDRAILLREGHIYADGLTQELLHSAQAMEACGMETLGER